jgi:hypothetical protein
MRIFPGAGALYGRGRNPAAMEELNNQDLPIRFQSSPDPAPLKKPLIFEKLDARSSSML